MTEDQILKIETALDLYKDECLGKVLPYTALSRFLETLKADSLWTDEEMTELQIRVLRLLNKTA